jgi:hypothetical protein
MFQETSHEESLPQRKPSAHWLRFSLKSLLLLTALIAVYFGGRASTRLGRNEPPTGTWQMNMLSGHQRPVTLTALPGQLFHLNAGGVLGGDYRWAAGQLQVVTPDDKRFTRLAWQWADNELVLIAEPPGGPAGQTYIGTRLRFVSSDISTMAQQKVQDVPSIIAIQQNKERGGVARLIDRQPAFRPSPWEDPASGEWQLTMPAGARSSVTLKKLDDGSFVLAAGVVLDGSYRVRDGQLEVVTPNDPRMLGLAWARQNDDLVLVSEPSPPPTGFSYLGARLRQAAADDDAIDVKSTTK